jgi:filamentous hemagglutinin family protein
MLSLGAMSVAHANIVVDANAPNHQQAGIRSYVDYCDPEDTQYPVEKIMINIQIPDTEGVSYNKYTQFDVNTKTVELNNHSTNPNLANNSLAKVILNEVSSLAPSQLNGHIRVLGDRAHVIFANPAGISCHGCEFTNASQITLTTGLPIFKSDSRRVASLNVAFGNIVIGLNGLSASGSQLELLATSIKIDGKVNANEIHAIAGDSSNRITGVKDFNIIDEIDRSLSKIRSSTGAYGVDIGNLGGMYADKIYITSVQKSIRNKGDIQGRDISILANKIHNQQGKITENDWIYGNYGHAEIKIVANKLLNGQGLITAKNGGIKIISKDGIINNKGIITITKGIYGNNLKFVTDYFSNENGYIGSENDLSISSSDDYSNWGINNKNGKIYARGTLSLTSKYIYNNFGTVISPNYKLHLKYDKLLNNNGNISGEALHITGINNDYTKYYSNNLDKKIQKYIRYTLAGNSVSFINPYTKTKQKAQENMYQ